MKFKYTALNSGNQQLLGVINAKDEISAKTELRGLGLSIVSMETVTEDILKHDKPRFEFEAIDKDNKKIIGTIPSGDEYEAYKRLRKEYKLNILSLYPQNLSEQEKQTRKISGIGTIKQKFEQEQQKELSQKQDDLQNIYKQERSQLLAQVDFTIHKVNLLLDEFKNDLPKEQTDLIKKLANKLLRIKNSANLHYIKTACEELLKTFQDQEKFLKEKVSQEKKHELITNTQKMMMDVQKISITSKHRIAPLQYLKNWAKEDQNKQSAIKRTLLGLIKPFLKKTEKNDQEEQIRDQIKVIHHQIFTYLKLLFKSSGENRSQIFESLRSLLSEKSRLKKKLAALKNGQIKSSLAYKKKQTSALTRELNIFTGWLLIFYFAYYFTANYFLTKKLPVTLNWDFYFYNSVLKYLIAVVFIIHASTSLKINFFSQKKLATLIIPPLGLFLILLVLFNF